MYQSNNMKSPGAEYLYKIQMIVSNAEFKNQELANIYETMESKINGELYVGAFLKKDTYKSYTFDDKAIYQTLLDNGFPEDRIYNCIQNPSMIPVSIRKKLLDDGRVARLKGYVELNKYYCNLAGLPFAGNDTVKPDRIVTIPDAFFRMYSGNGEIEQNQPIHTMSQEYQEIFMNTKFYKETLEKYPDAEYLKYIGSNKIPIEVSRTSRDGEIIRLNTDKLSGYHRKFGNVTVSPDIVNAFLNTYKQTRDYVYNTLRGNFSAIYPNYNSFIRFLTIYMAIGQTLNELMKKSSSMSFLNNASANNYFMLYGLPSVVMEGQSMIDFLKKFRLLLMDKGTNTVYRVKDYVGYKYTDIYTLVMVKQQVFENGIPKYVYDENGKPTPAYNIVFRRLGTTNDNTSYFKSKESRVEYGWREIASGDPRWWWWNDPEVDSMLYEMNYTLSNSKYIQLSTHMSLSDIYWQSIILLRGLLDMRNVTQYSNIAINYDFGTNDGVTVFDAVLMLVVIMNWCMNTVKGNFSGKLYYANDEYDGTEACLDMLFKGLNNDGSPMPLEPGRPFKVSSFNFDVRTKNSDFYNSLYEYDYLEPKTFINMLDKALDKVTKSPGELMMNDVRKLYDFLVNKLLKSTTIHEFRQVTDAFNNLFLVDPDSSKWFDNEEVDTIKLISTKYGISNEDITTFASFCMNIPDEPVFKVQYNENDYIVKFGNIMNEDVKTYKIDGEAMFLKDDFMEAYFDALDKYTSRSIKESSLPNIIKLNYINILKDKALLDVNQNTNGPQTFESLLLLQNPSLYTKLIEIRKDGGSLIFVMRAIIKALETYTNSELSALEFSAIGHNEYIKILKEIISYFKSYMVEFTKEEFSYIMDGLFDNGGNSNMLKLYDEITNMGLDVNVQDSIALYDVSNSEMNVNFGDDNTNFIYDDALFRMTTSYQTAKNMGYDIWFDDGNRITKNEPSDITNESEVTLTLTNNKIIIPVKNIKN